MSYACAVNENGIPLTAPAMPAQSAVWLAKCAWMRSTPERRARHAVARAFDGSQPDVRPRIQAGGAVQREQRAQHAERPRE